MRRILTEKLEAARKKFRFFVYGYVWMPEHVHLLISEPEIGTVADALHHFKLSSSKSVKARVNELHSQEALWQKRYYDRNLRGYREFQVKLRYTHRNPVKRGLCTKPEDWPWSSFRHYAYGEDAGVEIESDWTARSRPALFAKKHDLPG